MIRGHDISVQRSLNKHLDSVVRHLEGLVLWPSFGRASYVPLTVWEATVVTHTQPGHFISYGRQQAQRHVWSSPGQSLPVRGCLCCGSWYYQGAPTVCFKAERPFVRCILLGSLCYLGCSCPCSLGGTDGRCCDQVRIVKLAAAPAKRTRFSEFTSYLHGFRAGPVEAFPD